MIAVSMIHQKSCKISHYKPRNRAEYLYICIQVSFDCQQKNRKNDKKLHYGHLRLLEQALFQSINKGMEFDKSQYEVRIVNGVFSIVLLFNHSVSTLA